MTVAGLLVDHAPLWERATHHQFLDGVRDGTLAPASFDRWLVQDHLFVEALLRSQAGVLAGARREDFALLTGGLGALAEELGWFESVASTRALDLPGQPRPAVVAYSDLLAALPSFTYPAALTALWAIERAYLDAWRTAAPGAAAFRPFVEHWTTPSFATYVEALEAAADRAVSASPPDVVAAASAAVADVARHEAAFWDMAF